MKQDITFFLRFYDVTQDRIEECISKIKELGHQFTHETKPLSISMNIRGLQFGTGSETVLTFKSKKKRSDLMADDRVKQLYSEHNTPKSTGVVLRKPGQAAFSV
jgi:hypothetical protein